MSASRVARITAMHHPHPASDILKIAVLGWLAFAKHNYFESYSYACINS
jgi:hypothetical protein